MNTPGPWRYDKEFGEVKADGHGVICRPAFRCNAVEESKANAILLAAAPTLLAACQKLSALHPDDCILTEVKFARAAIRLATASEY